ncbi:hypothetical protein SKAU_G00014650 [Synaphobranchus kaupii]|uniref:Uncharacterized protein n=1 Tax=Synaphobranchus kaupii TaxID=118154 RepID=A0A9Q1GCH0_SYNKA|nr:hypothetical protein SKAU_G00014650 [Synaphobranchus kaupii]
MELTGLQSSRNRTSCCTFVPANDADGGEIDQAMNRLRELARLQQQELTSAGDGWWNWVLGGGWKTTILAVGGLLAGALGLLLICNCCGVPLIKGLISKMITGTPEYQALSMTDNETDYKTVVPPEKYDEVEVVNLVKLFEE